jgi:ANTAR domain
VGSGPDHLSSSDGSPRAPVPVALTRTPQGWAVSSPAGSETAVGLVEGLSLADLVAEEFGVLTEPDRTARRSARGPATATGPVDPAQARITELERTVAQLEHALAARVSTERAIGVLAERQGTSTRAAFEALRREARSHGRPVAQVAREVLDSLAAEPTAAPTDRSVPAPGLRRPENVVSAVPPRGARIPSGASPVAATDGAS